MRLRSSSSLSLWCDGYLCTYAYVAVPLAGHGLVWPGEGFLEVLRLFLVLCLPCPYTLKRDVLHRLHGDRVGLLLAGRLAKAWPLPPFECRLCATMMPCWWTRYPHHARTLYTLRTTVVVSVLVVYLITSPLSFFLYSMVMVMPFASGPITCVGGTKAPSSSSIWSPHRIFAWAMAAGVSGAAMGAAAECGRRARAGYHTNS